MGLQERNALLPAARAALNDSDIARFHYRIREELNRTSLKSYRPWCLELERVDDPAPVLDDYGLDVNFRNLRLALDRCGWGFLKVTYSFSVIVLKSVPETSASVPTQPLQPVWQCKSAASLPPHVRPSPGLLSATQDIELMQPRNRGLTMPVDASQESMSANHAQVPGIVSPTGQPPYALQDKLIFILGFGSLRADEVGVWIAAVATLVGYKIFQSQGYAVSPRTIYTDDRWGKIVEVTRQRRPLKDLKAGGYDTNF